MLALRILVFVYLALACSARLLSAAEPLLLIGQSPLEASLVGATKDGSLQFQVGNQLQKVAAQDLVRWSTPRTNQQRSEVLLADGSRLVLAAAWTGQPQWQIAEDSISVTTQLLGKVDLQRNQVRAIVLHAPSSLSRRSRFLDRLRGEQKKSDGLRLTNGDQLTGRLAGISEQGEGQRQLHFLLESTTQPLSVPEERIAAIELGNGERSAPPTGKLVVGLRDGSMLIAESLVADAKQLRLRLASGVELVGSDVRDVVYLRSLSAACVYLSDLGEADYQHVPYLDIPWPLHRDRNVLNGPLQAAGRRYDKGLGMHSAARLIYPLDTEQLAGRYQRFITHIAVDDLAAQRGSVIFRVYLLHDGDWQQAYASPVIRGGDPPAPVTVELGDAQQLALVTDFADRGDERDYANWLEARLE